MAWIETAGGIALPPPELGSCGVTISTMVDGARNGNGDFIGQVVGDDKLKIEVSFGMLTPSEMQTLLSLFDRKRGGKFINTCLLYTSCAVEPGGGPVPVGKDGRGVCEFVINLKMTYMKE